MKRTILLCLLCSLLTGSFAKTPEWLQNRKSNTEYIGVGSASMQNANYTAVAEQNALKDLADQISAIVETESFLATTEINNAVSEEYRTQIQTSSHQLLEGYEMEGTYTDNKANTYFVCYTLSKQVYRATKLKKEQEIIAQAEKHLMAARNATNAGNLFSALNFYEKGLQVVEPWLWLDLSHTTAAGNSNVPAELYNGYIATFDGLRLTAEPQQITLTTSTGLNNSINVTATRQGTRIPNVPVKATFTRGNGSIQESVKTDNSGVAAFRLTSVSSKQEVQEITFALDIVQMQKNLSPFFRRLLSVQTWPETRVSITQNDRPRIAYLNVSQNDLDAVAKQLRGVLASQHFTLTPEMDDAELFLDLKTGLDVAGTVQGEMYDLNECYVSLQLDIYNSRNQQLLTTLSINQLRVLVPVNATVEQTEAQCARELMKKVRQQLPKKLENL